MLVEPVVQRVAVAEQQLGGRPVGFEEFECRPQCGPKWFLGVAESCAVLGQRDGDMGAEGELLGGYQGMEKVVLRVEVPVDRPAGQPRLFGDVLRRVA
jgi:hypothetical protein